MVTTRRRRAVAIGVSAAAVMVLGSACGTGGSSSGGRPPGTEAAATSPTAGTSSPGATATDTGTPTVSPPASASASASWDGLGARVVYFSVSDRVPLGLREVLRGRAASARFAARVTAVDAQAASAIVAVARATDFSRSVLVVWTAGTGCRHATSAALRVTGDRVHVEVDGPEPPPECVAPDRLTVVFEAPKERLPAQPLFG